MGCTIVEIPYVYLALVVPPHKRKPVPVAVQGRVAVDFPLIDIADIPLVATVVMPHHDDWWSNPTDRSALSSEHRTELRALDGELYSAVGEAVHDLQSALDRQSATPLAEVQLSGWRKTERTWPQPITRADIEGHVVRDNEDESRASVIAAALGCVFADGRFWTKVAEPVWVLDRGSHDCELTLQNYSPKIAERAAICPIFRLDRIEPAEELLLATKKSYGRNRAIIKGRATVERPDCLTVRDTAVNLLSAAGSFRSFETQHSRGHPSSTQYAALGKFQAEIERLGEGDADQGYAEAARGLLKAFPAAYDAKALQQALALWDALPELDRGPSP